MEKCLNVLTLESTNQTSKTIFEFDRKAIDDGFRLFIITLAAKHIQEKYYTDIGINKMKLSNASRSQILSWKTLFHNYLAK